VSNDPRERVLVLIGAGAQTDSWAPVVRALRRAGALVETPEEANGVLAQIVQARRYNALANAYLVKRNGRPHEPSARSLTESADTYARICSEIRAELELAEGEPDGIKLRPELTTVLDSIVASRALICLMTTNWDLTLMRGLRTMAGRRRGCRHASAWRAA
jgi:hypothetical protein